MPLDSYWEKKAFLFVLFDRNGRQFECPRALDIGGKEFSHHQCEKHCFSLGCIRIWVKDRKERFFPEDVHPE